MRVVGIEPTLCHQNTILKFVRVYQFRHTRSVAPSYTLGARRQSGAEVRADRQASPELALVTSARAVGARDAHPPERAVPASERNRWRDMPAGFVGGDRRLGAWALRTPSNQKDRTSSGKP